MNEKSIILEWPLILYYAKKNSVIGTRVNVFLLQMSYLLKIIDILLK